MIDAPPPGGVALTTGRRGRCGAPAPLAVVAAWIAVAAASAASAACARPTGPELRSNVARLELGPRDVREAGTRASFTGDLVARGAEILAVSRALLDGAAAERVAGLQTAGLVLVIPIRGGVAQGRATLHLDLRAPELRGQLARYGDPGALAAARALRPHLAIAEATFVAGKLEGEAVAYAPTADGAGRRISARAQLRGNALHGEAIEYYRGTDVPRRRLRFDGGAQAGKQEWLHEDGTLARVATYVAGVPHGDDLAYYATGARRARARYERGAPVGTHEAWFPSGALERRVVYSAESRAVEDWYSNGRPRTAPPDGVIEEYYSTGAVHTRTTYAAGVKHGPYEERYRSGAPWRAGAYVAGQLDGVQRAWWKNGTLALDARYVRGALDGAYRRFYANGAPWEAATYVAGRRHGPYRKWWKNGAPAHVYEYRDGKLHGDYRQLYDTGAAWAVGYYAEGKPLGPLRRWFPDGKLGYVMHHEGGRPHGQHRRWWPSGAPRLVATYVRGALDGPLERWGEDGARIERATYRRGARVEPADGSAAAP
jgi:antitoxin component YwqK of YwqJK toxin-antitoxin module